MDVFPFLVIRLLWCLVPAGIFVKPIRKFNHPPYLVGAGKRIFSESVMRNAAASNLVPSARRSLKVPHQIKIRIIVYLVYLPRSVGCLGTGRTAAGKVKFPWAEVVRWAPRNDPGGSIAVVRFCLCFVHFQVLLYS